MTSKSCTVCLEVKPLHEFYRHARMPGGRQSRCAECHRSLQAVYNSKNREAVNARQREYNKLPESLERSRKRPHWYLKNPTKAGINQRRAHLKRKYGITPQDFDAMLAAQDGKCAICSGTHFGNSYTKLSVDHDHKTGKVRGLLCAPCNIGIAKFHENGVTMLSAIQYIQGHSA